MCMLNIERDEGSSRYFLYGERDEKSACADKATKIWLIQYGSKPTGVQNQPGF